MAKQTLVCDPNVSVEHFSGLGCVNICKPANLWGMYSGHLRGDTPSKCSQHVLKMMPVCSFTFQVAVHTQCDIPDVPLPGLVPLLISDCYLASQSQCASVSISGDLNELGIRDDIKTTIIHRRAGEGKEAALLILFPFSRKCNLCRERWRDEALGHTAHQCEAGLKSASPEPEACNLPL